MNGTRALLRDAARLRGARGRGAVATLVGATGSRAARPGERAWLAPDGALLGAVGLGGCADARVREALARSRDEGRAGALDVALGDDSFELGLVCSGRLELLVEPLVLPDPRGLVAALAAAEAHLERGPVQLLHGPGERPRVRAGGRVVFGPPLPPDLRAWTAEGADEGGGPRALRTADGAPRLFAQPLEPPPRLVVVGAGAVARALVEMAHAAGFRTTVTDARPERLAGGRFERADEVVAAPAGELRLPPGAHVVVAAHDYAQEVEALREALTRDAAYVGLLASRRRGSAVLRFLEDTGTPRRLLARVRTPAGLDLGDGAPAGIALSILSEIHARARGGRGTPLTPPRFAGEGSRAGPAAPVGPSPGGRPRRAPARGRSGDPS